MEIPFAVLNGSKLEMYFLKEFGQFYIKLFQFTSLLLEILFESGFWFIRICNHWIELVFGEGDFFGGGGFFCGGNLLVNMCTSLLM